MAELPISSQTCMQLLRDAAWLAPDATETSGPLRLVHNLEQPLWAQIHEGLATPIDAVHILSRYFDTQPAPYTHQRRCQAEADCPVDTECHHHDDPGWFDHPAIVERHRVRAPLRRFSTRSIQQPLHAKAIALVRGEVVRLAFGSANFTTSGLFSTSMQANVEVMVIVDALPLATCDPYRLFDPSKTATGLGRCRSIADCTAGSRPQREPRPPIELHEASLTNGVSHATAPYPPIGRHLGSSGQSSHRVTGVNHDSD